MTQTTGTVARHDWAEAVEIAPPGWLLLRASWAAVEPERGRYDDGVVERMRRALPIARRRGVEPVVVLQDGGLPDWVIARDGWLDPDVNAGWGCYVERLGRHLGELLRFWVGMWGPMAEARWYGQDARRAARAMVDAQSTAWVLLARNPGHGGRPPQVGVADHWAAWAGEGIRGRAEVELRQRLGPDALVKVLASGKLQPPFALTGELSNGSPAADFVGVIWDGRVRVPSERRDGDDPAALTAVLTRTWAHQRPVFVVGGDPAAITAAEAAGVRVLAHVP